MSRWWFVVVCLLIGVGMLGIAACGDGGQREPAVFEVGVEFSDIWVRREFAETFDEDWVGWEQKHSANEEEILAFWEEYGDVTLGVRTLMYPPWANPLGGRVRTHVTRFCDAFLREFEGKDYVQRLSCVQIEDGRPEASATPTPTTTPEPSLSIVVWGTRGLRFKGEWEQHGPRVTAQETEIGDAIPDRGASRTLVYEVDGTITHMRFQKLQKEGMLRVEIREDSRVIARMETSEPFGVLTLGAP